MIRRVTSPQVPEPPPERWSNCLVSDGIAYVSGMTARGTDAAVLAKMDEYEQAKLIFNKIKGMVEAAGGAMADVVKVTIYVTNIKNNTKVWAPRRSGDLDFALRLQRLHGLAQRLHRLLDLGAAVRRRHEAAGGAHDVDA